MRTILSVALVASFSLAALIASRGVAAPTAEQIKSVQLADEAMARASKAFTAGQFKEAGAAVEEAQKYVSSLRDVRDVQKPLARIVPRLRKAHALLELEGVSLPPLDLPGAANGEIKPKATGKTVPKKGTKTDRSAAVAAVSFTKQIAPVLVAKCGRCHVSQTRGGISMASYDALKRGSQTAGEIVSAGKPDGSRIVEVIESGDMPRGGGMVAADELLTLKKWIAEGAKFDGANPSEPLGRLVPNVMQEEAPQLQVVSATGRESVQFAKDVASILVKNCFDCHGPGRQDGGQLSMETFSGLLRGGQSGAAISPGKPDESLIVKKVKGTAGARMPLRRNPLPDSDIAKIEKWIAEGARFDGQDANQSLSFLVDVVQATLATHEELAQQRAERAREYWRLALPDDEPKTKESRNFFLMGNVDEEALNKLAQAAEAQATAVAKIFRGPTDRPLVKGKMTLIVLKDTLDYHEWWRMVEKRSDPPQVRGHFKYNVVDAYGCIVPPVQTEYSLTALLTEQIAGLYVANVSGTVPGWFAEGSARLIASRIEPRDSRVRQWNDQLPAAMASGWQPDGFLAGNLPLEQRTTIAYGFAKALGENMTKYNALLSALGQGQIFDQAFAKAYGAPPKDVLVAWSGKSAVPQPNNGRGPLRRGRQ
jgi:mono/diheme cytochrome c family protein